MVDREFKKYMSDFETTVYSGQDHTEVWAFAIVALDAPDEYDSVNVGNSISSWFRFIDKKLYHEDMWIGFHNLKFDGTFILDYLLNNKEWKLFSLDGGETIAKNDTKMQNKQFYYNISEKGLWYTITLKNHGHYCQIVDTLKLLPFSVKKLGKDFNLKHRKLEMEYEGERKAGGVITPEEEEYIKNDVLVVKEALNFMESQGHNSLTIGACCLKEYKHYYTKDAWEELFPNLYDETRFLCTIDDYMNIGDYIRSSYKGGWCYVVPEKAGQIYHNGTTADVNSLYPSMMHSDSGNRFPVGKPHMWTGDIPEIALQDDKYYFVRVRTEFKIKKNYLPCIQIKNDPVHYHPREWLTTSDWTRKKTGETFSNPVTMTLTMTDWILIQEHYDLKNTEILDGCWFDTIIGLFDEYIDKYAEIKMNSKGAMRQLAKLFLNNLYGKFATSVDSSYKICWLNDNGELRMSTITESEKEPGYIPIGSAITSYARNFTIRAAQKNYHGTDRRGFIYADTDSIHCDLLPDEIVGAPEDPVKFNHWKYESCWDFAKFVRQKTYVEHITHNDREPVEKPYFDLKCAGMPEQAKRNFIYAVTQVFDQEEFDKLDEEEREFIKDGKTWNDFDIGLHVPGMLKARHIKGGTVLLKGSYVMHPRI